MVERRGWLVINATPAPLAREGRRERENRTKGVRVFGRVQSCPIQKGRRDFLRGGLFYFANLRCGQ